MSERERWIVYPLLFLALGAALRDKLLKQTSNDRVVCEELIAKKAVHIVDERGMVQTSMVEGGVATKNGVVQAARVEAGAVVAQVVQQAGQPVAGGQGGRVGLSMADFLKLLRLAGIGATGPPANAPTAEEPNEPQTEPSPAP